MIYTNVTQTEGMFTYNFFCESLIGSMHNLLHAMEHAKADPPEKLGLLPEMLTQIGTNLMDDYGQEKLDLDRLKNQLLEFYSTAFEVNEAMVPIITRGSDEMRYYYFVFEQGIKLMFTNLFENVLDDLPEGTDTDSIMGSLMQEFARISE